MKLDENKVVPFLDSIVLVTLAGLAVLLFIPTQSKISVGSPLANDMSEVRQLVLALRLFAADNEDEFPESLDDLHPAYIDDSSLFTASFTASGKTEPYIYLGGVSTTSAPNTPLVVSPPMPSPREDRRVVGYVGGNVEKIEMTLEELEAAKQKQLPSNLK